MLGGLQIWGFSKLGERAVFNTGLFSLVWDFFLLSWASCFWGHYLKTGISRFWSHVRPWDFGHLGLHTSGAASGSGYIRTEAAWPQNLSFLYLGLLTSDLLGLLQIWGILDHRLCIYFLAFHKHRVIRFWSHLRPWDFGHLGFHTSGSASELGLLISGAFLDLGLLISGAFSDLGLLISDLGIFQTWGLFPGIQQTPRPT